MLYPLSRCLPQTFSAIAQPCRRPVWSCAVCNKFTLFRHPHSLSSMLDCAFGGFPRHFFSDVTNTISTTAHRFTARAPKSLLLHPTLAWNQSTFPSLAVAETEGVMKIQLSSDLEALFAGPCHLCSPATGTLRVRSTHTYARCGSGLHTQANTHVQCSVTPC